MCDNEKQVAPGEGGESGEVKRGEAEPAQAGEQPSDQGSDQAAHSALARAREAARSKGLRRRTKPKGSRFGDVYLPTSRSTARDPASLGDSVQALARQLGWNQPLSVGGVIGRWREVVGDQIADHCEVETFTEGTLVVRASSTAWATQIRLLVPQLDKRLAEEVGEGVVTEIKVLSPSGPSWKKGGRRAQGGRGPRDTYG